MFELVNTATDLVMKFGKGNFISIEDAAEETQVGSDENYEDIDINKLNNQIKQKDFSNQIKNDWNKQKSKCIFCLDEIAKGHLNKDHFVSCVGVKIAKYLINDKSTPGMERCTACDIIFLSRERKNHKCEPNIYEDCDFCLYNFVRVDRHYKTCKVKKYINAIEILQKSTRKCDCGMVCSCNVNTGNDHEILQRNESISIENFDDINKFNEQMNDEVENEVINTNGCHKNFISPVEFSWLGFKKTINGDFIIELKKTKANSSHLVTETKKFESAEYLELKKELELFKCRNEYLENENKELLKHSVTFNI
jgi:hypothetical protein